MQKRKKYTPDFKAKVVRELLEDGESLSSVSSKYSLNANMINRWRRELLDNASVVFSQNKMLKDAKIIQQNHQKEVDNLNRIIGKTTVERDYLRQCYEKISTKY